MSNIVRRNDAAIGWLASEETPAGSYARQSAKVVQKLAVSRSDDRGYRGYSGHVFHEYGTTVRAGWLSNETMRCKITESIR
ncbi:MAG TPA: hypothetical protein QF564_13120 [Pirellulaceae bacterium]|nr:hypothetical protein [Pirellulaceae bacterium]